MISFHILYETMTSQEKRENHIVIFNVSHDIQITTQETGYSINFRIVLIWS